MPDPEEEEPANRLQKVHFQTGRIRPISDRSPHNQDEPAGQPKSDPDHCADPIADAVGNRRHWPRLPSASWSGRMAVVALMTGPANADQVAELSLPGVRPVESMMRLQL
jgi:hypothetical protein